MREVVTLVLAELALRRGVDIEVNWIGRIGVFLVFGGIFWSMVVDWWIIEAGSWSGSRSACWRPSSTCAPRRGRQPAAAQA